MKFDSESIQHSGTVQEGFARIYAETNPPWDIGKPQPPFITVADQLVSPVLDSGCGTGGTSLYFASLGHTVTGIDFVEEAIGRARAKAAERGLAVDFMVKDAMTLGDWDRRFASIIDSGLFHIYAGEERRRYVQGLAHVLNPGGRLFLFSFNDDPGWPDGGVSRQTLCEAFAGDWEIESLELSVSELNPAFAAENPGNLADKMMWFAVIRRR